MNKLIEHLYIQLYFCNCLLNFKGVYFIWKKIIELLIENDSITKKNRSDNDLLLSRNNRTIEVNLERFISD